MQVLQCIAGAENLLAGQVMVPKHTGRNATVIAKLEAILCRPLYTAAALQVRRSPDDASRPTGGLAAAPDEDDLVMEDRRLCC